MKTENFKHLQLIFFFFTGQRKKSETNYLKINSRYLQSQTQFCKFYLIQMYLI